MFKINDYVMYGLVGACQITDIGKDEYARDKQTSYYVLRPVFDDNMTIKIPVDSPRLAMRPVISREAALALIASLPEQETAWTDDEKQRNAVFKNALRSGKPEDWVRLIKSVYLEKEARARVGKKIGKTEEGLMNTAEKLLNQELAVALNISPDNVSSYILEHIPEDKQQ
ncbi:MAG: transcriptional regulator [Syntrophomonadaceae bacterium]|jgi:CarD family transcriptional regulator|nr:transcriptional regulator [Syntrophomonadaceae bacterium]